MARLKFYSVWAGMLARCNNSKHPSYKYYGGRGIKVCERWKKYGNFDKDMYEEYGYYLEENPFNKRNIQCTLERIDNNENYCQENCKWATMKVQCSNRRPRKKKIHTPEQIEERAEKERARKLRWWNANKQWYRRPLHK